MTAISNEELLYQRLYISADDLHHAHSYASHLIKKGWHYAPWERRWSTYMQQAAFTSAFVTAYSRPFTRSVGWPSFPARLLPFDPQEEIFHKHLLELRHQVYAHSDSARHTVKPMRIDGHTSAIVGSPFLRLQKEELERSIMLINKIQASISNELTQLMLAIEAGPNNSFKPTPHRGVGHVPALR